MSKNRSTKRRLHKERAKARHQRLQAKAVSQPAQANVEAEMATAIQCLQAGRLSEAEQLLTTITETAANHAGAWHCLGIVVHQQNDNVRAEHCLQRAIELDDQRPTYYSNLSLVLLANGKPLEAKAAGEQAFQLGQRDPSGHIQFSLQLLSAQKLQLAIAGLEIAARFAPRDPVVHNCLGIVHRQLRDFPAALAALQSALEIRPRFAEAHNNLGNVHRDQGEHASARRSFEQAIQYKREFPEALNNLGAVLVELQDPATAIVKYREALRLRPDYVEALNNLGNALRVEGQLEESAAMLHQAVELQPLLGELHNNLGNVLRDRGQLSSAVASYRVAIECKPEFGEACSNLATALVDQGEFAEAEHWYQKSILASPDANEARRNLGNVYRLQHRLDEARQTWQACDADGPLLELQLSSLCPVVFEGQLDIDQTSQTMLSRWAQLSASPPTCQLAVTTTQLVEPPFHMQFFPGNLLPHKRAYAKIFGRQFAEYQSDLATPDGKPTIGVVVTRKHEGIFLKSMAGVLDRLPDQDMAIRIFSAESSQDRIRHGLRHPQIEFIGLPERFDLQARAIRENPCDVLYYWEIGTDATNYFLPFLRLAPVQVTSWGVQVTSGIDNVDYYLSSSLIEPSDAADHYSETLSLANTILSYQEPATIQGPPPQRGEFGLPESGSLYLSAQQIGKFHPDFDATLLEILQMDATARLVVTADTHGYAGEQLKARWQRNWGTVIDRVHMLPHLDREQYLRLISLATVCLDPPHFGGVNTSYDALSLGKIVVTAPSGFHRGRYTLGCYRRMGLTDLIAKDSGDYVRRALQWASDEDMRQVTERRIRESASQLFRDESAVSEHRRLFRQLIETARE